MRRNKLIVLVAMVFILSSTAIFSNAEQDKRKRFPNPTHRDIYSKNKFRRRRLFYNQKRHSFPYRVFRQWYTFSVRDNFLQLVPVNVTVKFKRPVSEFEAAYLFDHYRLKKSSGMRVTDNPFLIMFPGSRPDDIVGIPERPDFFVNYSRERPLRVHGKSQFLEAPEKDDIRHKETQGEKNQVLASTDDSTKKRQTSDPKRNIRSKAKIYSYRDSEGRLVFSNYGRSKSKKK